MSRQTETPVQRITAPEIRARKGGDPVVCLTAYTAPMAEILDPHCDLLLVGDSVGMVVHGLPSTVGVTMEMMILHGQAVMRGAKHAMVVVDMPFGSYEASPETAFANAARVLKETGAQAVKVEAGPVDRRDDRLLVERGIPVMGHVGLRPQAVNVDGKFRAKGRTTEERERVLAEARAADAGRGLRHCGRRRGRDARPRNNRRRLRPDHRNWRLGPVRRPNPGHGRPFGPVRLDPQIRPPLRRS